MKKKKIRVSILSALVAVSLVGCSSSDQPLLFTTPTTATQDGPLNYYAMASRLGAPVSAKMVGKQVASVTPGTAVGATAGAISFFFPESAVIMTPVALLATLFTGSTSQTVQLQDQINTINTTLAGMQTQINTIQGEINTQNQLYTAFVAQTTGNTVCGALINWMTALRNIYSSSANALTTGQCGQDAINIGPNDGIGNQFFQNISSNGGVATAAKTTSAMSYLANFAYINRSNFQSYVDSASASSVKNDVPLGTTWSSSVYTSITGNAPTTSTACSPSTDSNATVSMLTCGYQYFIANMLPTPGTQKLTAQSTAQNYIASLENYNNLVSNMYVQDALALQYAYNIEATSNYMNYVNYVAYLKCQIPGGNKCTFTQIPSWENLQDSTFSVGSGAGTISASVVSDVPTAGLYLTAAQQNLATLYAARVNNLYKTTMSFIISDAPLAATQSYAPPPASVTLHDKTVINFKPQTYTSIPAATLTSSTTSRSIPGSGLTKSGGLLYQYDGINQIWSCLAPATLQTLNNPNGTPPPLNLANCIPAFPASNNGYYDGVTMQAYGPSSGSTGGVVRTNRLDTNQYCNFVATPSTIGSPVIWNRNTLQCDLYGGSMYVNGTAFPGNDVWPPLVGGYLTWPKNYEWYSTPGTPYSIATTGTPPMFFIATGISSGYTYDAGSGYFDSTPNPLSLWDGAYPSGKTTSEGQAHDVLLQVNLPNGYNFPFYLFTASIQESTTGGTTLGINGTMVCPCAMLGNAGGCNPPGVTSCVQAPSPSGQGQAGQIIVDTSDGASYSISAALKVKTLVAPPPPPPPAPPGAPNGAYLSYCIDISWNSPILSATCQTVPGSAYSVTSSIDVTTCAPGAAINDMNGYLVCGN